MYLQYFFIVFGIFIWGALLFTIFYKRKEVNRELPLFVLIFNYLASFAPIGFFLGLYLEESQKKVDGVKKYRYSKKVRVNGRLIWILGLVSTILYFIN